MKFVDKQLAIKLRNKGFDRPCFGYYSIKDEPVSAPYLNLISRGDVNSCLQKSVEKHFIDAPTTDQVLEWLREHRGLHIAMVCSRDFDIDADGRELGSWVYWWYEVYAHLSADLIYQEEEKEYETYDEAILEGIEYVINNLI